MSPHDTTLPHESTLPRTLLRGARPLGGPAVDVLLADGLIAEIGPKLAAPDGAELISRPRFIGPGCSTGTSSPSRSRRDG